MYKAAICEDDKEQQNYIKNLLIKTGNDIQNIEIFDSGEALVEAYNNEDYYSILLLDMQMDKLDGIETAEIIRKYHKNEIIIIITSILEYAIKGYSINAFDFILKPIDEIRFNSVIGKAINKIREDTNNVYSIQLRELTKIIKLSDILYFESDMKKVIIHSINETAFNNESISEVERKLCVKGFIRISRFYLLNMAFIKEIKVDDIKLLNGEALRYSSKLQKLIKESYMNYILGGYR